MTEAQMRERIALLEELLTRALPVVRLTPYVKLTARIAEALGVKP
jgi:hypothetical protein